MTRYSAQLIAGCVLVSVPLIGFSLCVGLPWYVGHVALGGIACWVGGLGVMVAA